MSSKPNFLSIGALSRMAGCKVQTIRYYEQIGLMPAPGRTSGNQRAYGRTHANRLAFIRHSRELGFPLEAIRELLTLCDSPGRSCAKADSIAHEQLLEVDSRLLRLNALKKELERMIKQCRKRRIADCRIIEVLSDHNQCLSRDHLRPTQSDLGKQTR
jgi:DNA-binding transcriptional MerR regulator